MNQEKMIRFYKDKMAQENKEQRIRTFKFWICKVVLLIPSIVCGGAICYGFLSSAVAEILLMFFTVGFSFVIIASINQGEHYERQISDLKCAIFSQTIYFLTQNDLSTQKLQEVENIMNQTMKNVNQIDSDVLEPIAHINQIHRVYRIYHDRIRKIFVSKVENMTSNVSQEMKNNADCCEQKVSEPFIESPKEVETNRNNFDPKISVQLELTELLMQKGLTLEQTVHLLSTYSKNDYPTLIALFKTDMIPLETLQDNSISLIDDRMKREYVELIENVQTPEGKQAIQKRYYQNLLNKYLESTIPDSEDNFTKKKMR